MFLPSFWIFSSPWICFGFPRPMVPRIILLGEFFILLFIYSCSVFSYVVLCFRLYIFVHICIYMFHYNFIFVYMYIL